MADTPLAWDTCGWAALALCQTMVGNMPPEQAAKIVTDAKKLLNTAPEGSDPRKAISTLDHLWPNIK